MKSSLKIVIAEKRMRDLVGHFADVTKRMCVAGESKGLNFDVYCSSSADMALEKFLTAPNIRVHPKLKSLTLPTWEKVLALPVGRDNYKRWRKKLFPATREAFEADLFNAPLFLPTADVSDLLGILQHDRKFNCILGFWYSPEMEFSGATDALINALAASNTANLQIGAYDNETLKDLSSLEKYVDVVRLPCPYDQEVKFATRQKSDKIKVGFFGFMGRERGGRLKEEIKQLCTAAGFDVLDESKTTRKPSKFENNPPAYASALGETMSKCDIIVWPSDAAAYAHRTSGIVFHSIANGIPIVVPEKCRPQRILESLGHPHTTFASQESNQIVFAITRLANKVVLEQKDALLSAKRFNNREGTHALVEFLSKQLSQ